MIMVQCRVTSLDLQGNIVCIILEYYSSETSGPKEPHNQPEEFDILLGPVWQLNRHGSPHATNDCRVGRVIRHVPHAS